MLTMAQFDDIKEGEIFARGFASDDEFGINMSRSGQCLRWLAIKGYANDWCVYVALHFGHSGNEDEYVAKVGDKVSMKENIRRALPCEDAVLERYRY